MKFKIAEEQDDMHLIQLKHKQIKEVRENILEEQGGICPLCNYKIDSSDAALDHQHRTKFETVGVDGAGLCRGVLHKTCNSLEGQMLSKFKRSGVKGVTFPQYLRNLADYLEKKNYNLIHPSEIQTEKFSKRLFNKLLKLYIKKYPNRKPIEYPKTGNLTKKMSDLLEEFVDEL